MARVVIRSDWRLSALNQCCDLLKLATAQAARPMTCLRGVRVYSPPSAVDFGRSCQPLRSWSRAPMMAEQHIKRPPMMANEDCDGFILDHPRNPCCVCKAGNSLAGKSQDIGPVVIRIEFGPASIG